VRILVIDIDTLRPDHLGCYGYHRNTSPNIDRVAEGGVRFENCYVTDAPCLPSRGALYNARYGVHTGIVNHGGTNADLGIEGAPRGFKTSRENWPWITALKDRGLYCASISPFAERHSAWWFCAGWKEFHNPGKSGGERADEVAPIAIDWIERNAKRDDWLLHVNMWDPHTRYRTPMDFGDPFADEPPAAWLTEEIITRQREGFGSHSARDTKHFEPHSPEDIENFPRLPAEIRNLADFTKWINGYDTGIRYADEWTGRILAALEREGVLEETAIIVTSDHGENQGELNVYGDHQTADHITSRVPLIVRWPGVAGGRADRALHYQMDLAPTVLELLGGESPKNWDAASFAASLRAGTEAGRDFLVASQCAWSCQRMVRWGDWAFLRTYHDGLKDLPERMLFNLAEDPHETRDLAAERPDVVREGLARLDRWVGEVMSNSPFDVDPMWTVIREGGPFHTRGREEKYRKRLTESDRAHHAAAIRERYARGEFARKVEA